MALWVIKFRFNQLLNSKESWPVILFILARVASIYATLTFIYVIPIDWISKLTYNLPSLLYHSIQYLSNSSLLVPSVRY